MPKVTFAKDFVWKAKRGVRIVYKAGATYPVTSTCLAEAMTAGAVQPQGKPASPRIVMDSDDARG